jgi:hypothetical protein
MSKPTPVARKCSDDSSPPKSAKPTTFVVKNRQKSRQTKMARTVMEVVMFYHIFVQNDD